MHSLHVQSHPFGPSMVVERVALDNGLTVLVLIDDSAPVLCYQTWFRVGSRHERSGKTGIAHLFEHLMFSETRNVPYGEFDRRLEEAGAEANAATFLDWTYYIVELPLAALELVVTLESDRMENLVLREEQVANEREVVANERRQTVDNDVDGSVGEMLYHEAFREHGYRWATIGRMQDIKALTIDDCRAFYRTHYAPNNAVLVVVGHADLDRLIELIVRHYGAMEPSEIPVENVRPEPLQQSERRQRVQQPTPTPKLVMGYRCPGYGDFDHPALVLLNEILFGGRSSRVHRQLVEQRELATHVRGYVATLRDPGLYEVWLTAREETSLAALQEAVDAIFEDVRREPPTAAELKRAQARVELASLQGLETVSGKAVQIGFGETVVGNPCFMFDRLDAFRRVDRSDLLRVARRYLDVRSRSVVEVEPDARTSAEASP